MIARLHRFGIPGLKTVEWTDGELNGRLSHTRCAKLRPGAILTGDGPEIWPLRIASIDDDVARHGLEKHLVDCGQATGRPDLATWFAMKS